MAKPARGRLTAILRAIAREPLAQFMAVGALFFAADLAFRLERDAHRVTISGDEARRLARTYERQFGAPPPRDRLEALIDQAVDEEILYREALALGLGSGDEIVRRRLVQKMRFLMQDRHPPAEPTDEDLTRFYRERAETYRQPPQVSFSHVFFRDTPDGAARAERVLALMPWEVDRAPERGDHFPDLFDFTAIDPAQAARVFGAGDLVDALFRVAPGVWSGPFRSGYGWHIVKVTRRTEAATPPLASVRDRVRADYLAAAREAADKADVAALRARYVVVRPHGDPPP